MRAIYIWQQPTWPHFTWDNAAITPLLAEVHRLEGRLQGVMSGLGFDVQCNTSLDVLTDDVVRSSEIEGEQLDNSRVRSSIARHLGLSTEGMPHPDHYTEGIVQVMMDANNNSHLPLTHERLYDWHAALFPTGRSGIYHIRVGAYRQGQEPMQVVSGAMGHERVHYEAPPSCDVAPMMESLLTWIESKPPIDSLIVAAIAHLWFVAIHPFDDGNGRLTRTVTDMLLTRAEGEPRRFYSISAEILRQRKSYYEALEKTTTGGTDITYWLQWFLHTMRSAILHSQATVERTVRKAQFWIKNKDIAMNQRQVKVVNMLWDGFNGNLTTSKWAKITKTSQATALRDITYLVEKGILEPSTQGGRSTHYTLSTE